MVCMSMKANVEAPGERRLVIRRVLERQGVINVRGLERALAMDVETVREALDYWVSRGEAEVLRPCRQRLVRDDEWDYYRWKRTSDKRWVDANQTRQAVHSAVRIGSKEFV